MARLAAVAENGETEEAVVAASSVLAAEEAMPVPDAPFSAAEPCTSPPSSSYRSTRIGPGHRCREPDAPSGAPRSVPRSFLLRWSCRSLSERRGDAIAEALQ